MPKKHIPHRDWTWDYFGVRSLPCEDMTIEGAKISRGMATEDLKTIDLMPIIDWGPIEPIANKDMHMITVEVPKKQEITSKELETTRLERINLALSKLIENIDIVLSLMPIWIPIFEIIRWAQGLKAKK